jgi:hypothetical protein
MYDRHSFSSKFTDLTFVVQPKSGLYRLALRLLRHTKLNTHTHSGTHTHTAARTHTHTHRHAQSHTERKAYIHTHTCRHTHTHTRTDSLSLSLSVCRNPLFDRHVVKTPTYTTHNRHKRETSMPSVRFSHATAAIKRPKTRALDRKDTDIQFTYV